MYKYDYVVIVIGWFNGDLCRLFILIFIEYCSDKMK